jgi:hypothetical protein
VYARRDGGYTEGYTTGKQSDTTMPPEGKPHLEGSAAAAAVQAAAAAAAADAFTVR